MSGEKNDLFTSLSSFLKMCQLSSVCSHAGSLQLWWGDALWPLSTETEGKMSETPLFFDLPSTAAAHAQGGAANLQQLLPVTLACIDF